MKHFIPFNLNDNVRFLVTEATQEAYREYQRKVNAELYEPHGMRPSPIWSLEVDADGYAMMQAHMFMHVFGPHTGYPRSDCPVNPCVLVEVEAP